MSWNTKDNNKLKYQKHWHLIIITYLHNYRHNTCTVRIEQPTHYFPQVLLVVTESSQLGLYREFSKTRKLSNKNKKFLNVTGRNNLLQSVYIFKQLGGTGFIKKCIGGKKYFEYLKH